MQQTWRGGGSQSDEFIDEGLDLGVLNVLHNAVVSVLCLWSRLGDTGLLQPWLGIVCLGFSQAVDDDFSQESED